ncbi:MAG: ribonuclease J, partial [Alphaproteobacteria bacterium]
VGRSMHRMAAAARHVGLFKGVQDFVSEEESGYFPDDNILYLCTGSQGEPRAALSRIAEGTHRNVSLGKGDHCIFSSRVIPGNEVGIRNLQNNMAEQGVRIHTDREHPGIHVSGHPCRDELREMYQWARPRIAVPTHGERRHLLEHAAFARDMQVPEQVSPRNGDMVRLAPGRAEIIDEVPAGRLYVDGTMIVPAGSEPLRERRHAAYNGVLTVAIALDAKGRIVSGPQVRAIGLPSDADDPLEDLLDEVADDVEVALKKLKGDERDDDEVIEAAIKRVVKKTGQRLWDRRPVVEVTVLRV